MRIEEFDYELPLAQIAQHPLPMRDASRMLLLDRQSGEWQDRRFLDLPELLRGDELLVFNNARVIPARLFGRRAGVHSQRPSRSTAREHLTGTVEVFLLKRTAADTWEALVRPGRKLPVGERVIDLYRSIEGLARTSAHQEFRAIARLVRHSERARD